MSKLAPYQPVEQLRIKALMPLLLEIKVERGELPETDESLKAALPHAFNTTCRVIEASSTQLARYTIEPQAGERIQALAFTLFLAEVQKPNSHLDEPSLVTLMRRMVADACKVNSAVEEYLCG